MANILKVTRSFIEAARLVKDWIKEDGLVGSDLGGRYDQYQERLMTKLSELWDDWDGRLPEPNWKSLMIPETNETELRDRLTRG